MPPDSHKRSCALGCAAFSPLLRCPSVSDHCGYAPSSRLGETKNRQERGMAEYFNRLLEVSDRCVVFAAMMCLDCHVNQFVMPAK
jgi:hypothetical protein